MTGRPSRSEPHSGRHAPDPAPGHEPDSAPRRELRAAPRQGRSEATIDALLDAADAVFDRVGVAEATTVMIARQAGVSVGRLYYWFHDRDAIAEALSQRHQRRLVEFLTAELVDLAGVPTPALVRRIVDAFAEFLTVNRGALALLRRPTAAGSLSALRSTRVVAPVAAAETPPVIGMRGLMIDLIAGMVAARVADSTVAEQRLVAVVLVDTVVGTLETSMAEGEVPSEQLRAELAYLVAAYLYARYPSDDDPVWSSTRHPIRPARRPTASVTNVVPVHPVMP